MPTRAIAGATSARSPSATLAAVHSPSIHTVPAMPVATASQLTLEDVARDAFRRKFFLDAFPEEKEALELSFSFLQRIRQYKQLIGKRDALQDIAEELVTVYLRDPPPHLCVFLRSTAVLSLLDRIVEAVQSHRSTPDLFNGMEAHVNDRLEKETFVAFLQTTQYTQLCDAIRKRRELPLGEILVDARRTHFLEQFLVQNNGSGVGNLRFWVDVQTVFLPLIQTNAVSVALFEEIQTTVRRLYNQFIAVSSPTVATAVPETLRSDILKRIMQLQGEPFSPSRYATLFRQAQEKIWHWMQTVVYPKFQASLSYVALVVETENLESDRQLRKLSEHVEHARATSTSQLKLSAIVIPVESQREQPSRHVASESRFLRVVAPLEQNGESDGDAAAAVAWQKTLRLPDEAHLGAAGVRSVCVVRVTDVKDDGQLEMDRELRVTVASSVAPPKAAAAGATPAAAVQDEDAIDCMDFLWNWRDAVAIPAVLSPSHRPQATAPKPSFRSFSLPLKSSNASTIYGYAVICWVPRPSTHSSNSLAGTPLAMSSAQQLLVLLPRFVYVLTSQPLERRRVAAALHKLSGLSMIDVQELEASSIQSLFPVALDFPPMTPRSVQFKPQYSGFYLHKQLSEVHVPVHWLFKELSHQTIVAVLGALLVGKSLVVVCPRPSALVLVANALVELLRPFEWQHLFLPLCPVRTACALADRTFFVPAASSSTSSRGDLTQQLQSPFIVGLEAELAHLKTKDSANEPRHRIRNSIYSVQRVSLQLRPPRSAHHAHAISCQLAEYAAYPTEILHTQAVVLDVDADDVYFPDRVEIPEFPQSLVRNLEIAIKDAMLGGGLTTADSRLFRGPGSTTPAFLDAMLRPRGDHVDHNDAATNGDGGDGGDDGDVAIVDSVRCAMVTFLESLFGDVVFYFCSFRKSFAATNTGAPVPSTTTTTTPAAPATVIVPVDHLETYVIFEADAFLDAKIEVGCRDFFRQVFQTELFRQFVVRQHQRFAMPS